MSRRRSVRAKREVKVGLPPGSAVYVGEPRQGGVVLSAFVYDTKGVVEHTHADPETVRSQIAAGRVVWLDCDGVHDVALVTDLTTRFGLHALVLEDVLNTETRPKLDLYDNNTLLLAVDMVSTEDGSEVVREHVSFVVGQGFLISFQEGRAGDLFDPVRQRIRSGNGRIRALGPDYLLHALVDAIVDGYFVVLERLEERIDVVEGEALDGAAKDFPARVYGLKTDLSMVRRSAFPLREVVGRLQKGEAAPQVTRVVDPYLRDLYDHLLQVLDMVDGGRERLNGVLEVHLAVATHKMNDVMKVLTVVSTVFIPLSWVAGVYGMNFEYMPELHWWWSYPAALGLMLTMAAGMLLYFRRNGWM